MKVDRNDICNGCKFLDFRNRKCNRQGYSDLRSFTSADGYVALYPTSECGRTYFTKKKKKKESK